MNTRIQSYFLFLLAKRDYSEEKLRQKALQKSYELEEINEVILWLKQNRYVDDERFAEQIIQTYQKNRGNIWLKQKLLLNGISAEIINKKLFEKTEEDFNYGEIKKLVEKKYKIENWNQVEAKELQKIMGYIGRRGFVNAWEIVKNWKNNYED